MAGKSRHNRDRIIVEALARGEGQTAAATLAGCSVSTIRRRLDDAEFRARVEKFRAEMLDAAAGKLGSTVVKAVSTLESLLSIETPPAVRMASAKALVEFALRTREALSWEKRLADLEARACSAKT